MFAQLPEIIKQEIIQHLKNNNFPAAKKLHDDWLRDHPANDYIHHSRDSDTTLSGDN
jgi:hypothetical protein